MAITRIALSSLKTLNKSDSFLDGNPPYIPSSFESIATASASGGTTSISFTSIPSTYKSLQIRGIATGVDDAGNSGSLLMRFNSLSTSVYNRHTLWGDGSSPQGTATASTTSILLSGVSQPLMLSYPYAYVIDIIDYASTTKFKTARAFVGCNTNNTYSFEVSLVSGLFRDTTAISSITLSSPGFYAGSSFALYGVK
jgi:hypothetical protein